MEKTNKCLGHSKSISQEVQSGKQSHSVYFNKDFDPHSCGVAEGNGDVVGELDSQAVLVWVDKLEQEQVFGGQQRGSFW